MTNLSKFDFYGSHLIPLYLCLRYTTGPILEFGAGAYSTILIHMFAVEGRYAR